jgi:hypothetical protein
MDHSLDDLFADVAAGRLSAGDGAERLRRMGYVSVGDFALLDVSRAARKGVPEVLYAEGKTVDQVVAITRRFIEHDPVVLCSRASDEQAAARADAVDGAAVEHDPRSRVVVHSGAVDLVRERRRLLVRDAAAQHHGVVLDEAARDGDDLLDRLALRVHHLGHALARRPRDVEEGEVAHRDVPEPAQALGTVRSGQPAGGHFAEELVERVVHAARV